MKKYFYILQYISVIMLLASTSCVPLEVSPDDRDTDANYWDKPESAKDLLNTCYKGIASFEEVLYADAMSDNAYTKVPTAFNQNIGNGKFSTADTYVGLVWSSRYAGIRDCNILLANINKTPGLSEEVRNRYIAEATVIRANHYFELYSRFGDIPYFTHVISIVESRTISRTPKADVVTSIINELDNVINNNYLSKTDGGEKGRLTHWAALAIKARILLFEGRYGEVKTVTNDIMTNGGFSLFPNYGDLFTVDKENNQEVILDVQYLSPGREHAVQYHFLPPSLKGYAQLSPLQELVDDYITLDGYTIKTAPGTSYDPTSPYDKRDPRLEASICYTNNSYKLVDGTFKKINCDIGGGEDGFDASSNASNTGYYIKKYWDNTYRGALMSGLNIIVVRYADVLLMHAEAAAELGQLDATTWNKTIKLTRERAGFTDPKAVDFPTGAADLKDIVRRERRCELALEGLRYKDIIRWRIAEKVLNGNCHGLYTGDVIGTDNGYVIVEKRQFDKNKNYLWPVPQSQRDLNANLGQNPNW